MDCFAKPLRLVLLFQRSRRLRMMPRVLDRSNSLAFREMTSTATNSEQRNGPSFLTKDDVEGERYPRRVHYNPF